MSEEHQAEANLHLELLLPFHNIKTPSTELFDNDVNKNNQKDKQPTPSIPHNNHANASPSHSLSEKRLITTPLRSSSFAYSGHVQWQCFPYTYNTPFGSFLITPPVLHPLQIQTKKLHCHCQIDLDTIVRAEDRRTTLIIKNIPNKYISKMLLYEIEENHHATYDFLYLPINYKNNGNLGYALINMLSHLHIVSFYKAFHGKKWDTHFGEQVISLEYAWIQGKDALVTYFQNSGCICELCFSRRWPIPFR